MLHGNTPLLSKLVIFFWTMQHWSSYATLQPQLQRGGGIPQHSEATWGSTRTAQEAGGWGEGWGELLLWFLWKKQAR